MRTTVNGVSVCDAHYSVKYGTFHLCPVYSLQENFRLRKSAERTFVVLEGELMQM